VVLDGEEESESASLLAALPMLRDRLRADLMLCFDGPGHPVGRPTVVYGVRGIVTVNLTVYGPKSELHSGHYGNWVPNPAMRLARLLASMKDDDGHVLVKGFYDGIAPLTPAEEAMLRAVPDDPTGLMKRFGIAAPERPGLTLQQALQLPTLNVRGLASADVGTAARTVIPATATASIDIRLVQETPATAMVDKIRAHIREQGFFVVDADPDDATRAGHSDIVRVTASHGTEAYRTDPAAPLSKQVADAVGRIHGQPPVLLRTMGGTLPIAPIAKLLEVPVIVVPTVNFDNNQHSDNENLRLGHLFESVKTLAALLTM
jgi:acetylornithine deacetylase/succinyl-diaminopimelate desuccinylase-like protein